MRSTVAAALTAPLLALTLAGCGTGSSSTAVTSTTAATTAPGPATTSSDVVPTGVPTGTPSARPTPSATTAGPDATFADLQVAQVPPVCRMPAVTLVDGRTPANLAPRRGAVARAPLPVLVDLDGDGHVEAVTGYECTAGTVSAPVQVLVVGPGGRSIGRVDLARDHQEHAVLVSMTAVARGVDLAWKTYDGSGLHPHPHAGTLRLVGGQAVVGQGGATPAPTTPAPGSSAPPGASTLAAGESAGFSSPTGNITCRLTDADARCQVDRPRFAPPPKPAGCSGDWGSTLALAGGSAGHLECSDSPAYVGGDTQPPRWWSTGRDGVRRPGGTMMYTLGYGHVLQSPAVRCQVAPAGVTCATLDGAHGFTLARARYTAW